MKLIDICNKFNSKLEFLEALKQEVIKLGTSNPDFVYNPNREGFCTYYGPAKNKIGSIVGPKCNGCIFGQALQNMGCNNYDELGMSLRIDTYLNTLILNYEIKYQDLLEKFRRTQACQDLGGSWKKSISELIS
jgi:hypothetical protein